MLGTIEVATDPRWFSFKKRSQKISSNKEQELFQRMVEQTTLISLLFTAFTIKVGLSFLACQIFLYTLFSSNVLGDGPWSSMPAFTAHQIVVVPVLLFLSAEGLREWYLQDVPAAAVDRLLDMRNGHLFEFVLGMMIFWDIPTGLLTPALFDLPMVLHHLGMCATAAIAMGALSGAQHQPVMGYYAPFFFGMIELSSIPLIIVDLFHPKHKEWHAYLTSDSAPTWVGKFNEMARILFAVSFFLMRTLWFPYVTFTGVIPDVLEVAAMAPEERDNISLAPLYTIATLNILFSALQFYWGLLLMRQVLKLFQAPRPEKDKTP